MRRWPLWLAPHLARRRRRIQRRARGSARAAGVERVVEISLNKDEQEMFTKSVESVKGLVAACRSIKPELS